MPSSLTYISSLLALFLQTAHAGKILVLPHDGSHWVNMKVLVEELHLRGHNITVIRASDSWYISSSPHYKVLTVNFAIGANEEFYHRLISEVIKIRREQGSAWASYAIDMELKKRFSEYHKNFCEMVIIMFENKQLMKSFRDAEYDAVLTDPANGAGVMLAHYLGLPLVLNVRYTIHGEGHFVIAPSPLSYVPSPAGGLSDKMTFWERVKNRIHYHTRIQLLKQAVGPHYTALSQRYFGPDVDYVSLIQAADLWLMRVDFTFEFPRPTMPNVAYIGGFQCKPAKPLPQHLEDFVHSSGEHGVIIMSLGTLVSDLPHDIVEEIAATFARLPQKVIWRYRGEIPSTLGNNTLLVDWMPQNDLLGHPKIRAFIAHGGTNGIFEAIYHGVPIIGIPIMFDQPDNLSRMAARGVAKVVDISELNRSMFEDVITEVLHKPSYRLNMERLSRLHRDRPMEPLDVAVFWIEFVMRHKGAAHLRTESFRMPWYSYYCVDVIIFLGTIALLTSVLFALLLRSCIGLCLKRKKKQE